MTQKSRIIKVSILLLLCMTFFLQTVLAQDHGQSMDKMWGESKVKGGARVDGRAQFFDESNYGMFIHWGLYSMLAGEWEDKTYYGIGEWLMNSRVADIPPKDYMKVAGDFNPVDFDAQAIAQLAKDAGMKYIIIVSKHHDGFAMFDSKADPFNIIEASPFTRDPMKELSQACNDLGLGFGFYYSHNQDWTAAGGTNGPQVSADGKSTTFEDYFYRKCKPQVRELCTNYGELDFVWFDTPGGMKKELIVELATMVRELQPNALMSSRVGHGLGDYLSHGDMEVPAKNLDELWESVDTNNDSWSFAWYDNNFKDPKTILTRLISTVARGGTYLFNVGPDGKGNIPEIGAIFLKEAGAWINAYPEVIYDAKSSPWGRALPWGDVTVQGKSLYFSVFDWPEDGKLYISGLDAEIESATLLYSDDKNTIEVEKKNGWTILQLSNRPLDQLIPVIKVTLENEVSETPVDQTLAILPNTSMKLLAEFASVNNADKKSIRWMEKFGEWKRVTQISDWQKGSSAEWEVDVFEPGYYYLELEYKGEGRLVWKTTTDEGVMVQNEQAATEKFIAYPMGILEFKTAGKHKISVSLVDGDSETSSLSAMKLRPIKSNFRTSKGIDN